MKNKIFVLSLFVLFKSFLVFGLSVGLDDGVQAFQDHITFPNDENGTNRINNYAVMNNGFCLADLSTTVSFASIFPVSGSLFLTSGKVFFEKDLVFSNLFTLNRGGQFFGNSYSVTFPKILNPIEVPADLGGDLLLLSEEDTGLCVYSVDWLLGEQYVIAGTFWDSVKAEMYIYSFDGTDLTIAFSIDLGIPDVWTVAAHPTDAYFAFGMDYPTVTKVLEVYEWDTDNQIAIETDSKSLGADVVAVAWSPDGNYLAVVTDDSTLRVYSFSNGTLTSLLDTEVFSTHGTPSDGALSWKDTSDYLVIGTTSLGSDVLVYSFNGSSLTLDALIDTGGSVWSVSWRPGDSLIAVGLYVGTERLRIYEHSSGVLTEKTSARVGETISVYGLDWSPEGAYLAVGQDYLAQEELKIYYLDEREYELILTSSDNLSYEKDINSVKFSPSGRYLITGNGIYGESDGKIFTFGFEEHPIVFDNTHVILNSDLNLDCRVTFIGDCSIDGRGKRFVLKDNGEVVIDRASKLVCQNINLYGLAETNLNCVANDSIWFCEDSILTLTNDFEFGTGSMVFEGDVVISGTNKFIYSTVMASSIDPHSTLILDKCLTFSYAPKSSDRDLIYMTDKTSWIYMDGCSLHSTATGIRLTRGKLFLDNNVTFSSSSVISSEVICFGDGNSNNDLDVNFLSGAHVDLYGGLEYENVG